MANKTINIAELEFDQIKENLKTYLRGQSRFSDYDFDGSNMSIILDLLAYNTHYNSLYMNMVTNEAYLDSASRRDSVVSLSKALGYLPRSSTCAKADVNFTVTNVTGNPAFLTIEDGTEFYGTKDGIRYTFSVEGDVTVARNTTTNEYYFNNVRLIEGTKLLAQFEYTDANAFILPNSGVDVSTVKVRVQPSPSSTSYTTYSLAANIPSLNPTSTVFFLKEIDGGFYQMFFGDDVLGKKLTPGNTIIVNYYVCNGEDPNGITSLTYNGQAINGGSVTGIQLVDQPVYGGRYPELIEDIRFNAPNMYAAQNRAVTALDYESVILRNVPSINAVSVWGGETNNPPIYGKVFISAKTITGKTLTLTEQQSIITTVLDNYRVLTTIPEFIPAETINVELDVVAYYDPSLTVKTSDQLRTEIYEAILGYNENELRKFNRILRHSAISRLTENIDPSIVSCVPRMKIYREVTPIYNVVNTYTVNIGNPFTPGTITTNGFYISTGGATIHYIDDDGNGNLTMYKVANGERENVSTVGTVDYNAGTITINNINIVALVDASWVISGTPSSADIASVYNQVVQLDTARLKVNMISDLTANGLALAGGKFQFTSVQI